MIYEIWDLRFSMLLFPVCEPIVMRGMEKRKRNEARVTDPAVLTRARRILFEASN